MATSDKSTLDPQQQQIGAVYAKSLLAAARDSGALDEVVNQLVSLGQDVLSQQPRLLDLMTSNRVSQADKYKMLDRIFQSQAHPVLLNFLKVVSRKGRFDCLPAIAHQAQRLYHEEIGVVQTLVTSASELDDSTRDQIAGKLESILGKKVDLSVSVDPSLLGGLKIRVGDTVFDGSLQTQLERVRAAAFEKSAEQIRSQFDRFAEAG